jgi:hypothetical protein
MESKRVLIERARALIAKEEAEYASRRPIPAYDTSGAPNTQHPVFRKYAETNREYVRSGGKGTFMMY